MKRLEEDRRRKKNWKRWGPYLAERAWGTVREDYSLDGSAWDYFPHHQAPSKTYRWNEDGIAGLCDRHQFICFAPALWNGRDPILKERLFGLTGPEGNHGEDVKEYFYYLDSTPTHSYLKCLYKYPQAEFPYVQLVEENRRRGRQAPEFELMDTGVFEGDRYFDVVTEYAKGAPNDVLIRFTVTNRGPEAATLRLLPTVWYRNVWSWGLGQRRARLWAAEAPEGRWTIELDSDYYGRLMLHGEGGPELLFTENETNFQRLY
ncbi:MAG TPA: glucosidase, partial [Thermoanaerobaculia bacterium]|nr:glucosidase [Thermoanaerobaculia bacterium]